MAAALKAELGLDATLAVGDRGEFTIWVDGKNVAGKDAGRFPEPGDVVAAVRAVQARSVGQ